MSTEWFKLNAPGYSSLRQEELEAIKDFSLLWSLFEAQLLNSQASANSIEAKVNSLNQTRPFDERDFSIYKTYFVDRYTEINQVNNNFTNLHLRVNDKPDLIRDVLEGRVNSINNVVTAMLIIIYRYRNNFFHGVKLDYEFKGQQDNFQTANSLLMKMMDINNQ